MPRIDTFQLFKLIPNEEFDYTLLCSILSPYKGVRQKIHELLKAGIIIRVKKGLYVFGQAYNRVPICKEVLANLIYGPSCISLQYALSYYGVIPERVEAITSVTPKKDKKFQTTLGSFTYRYLALEKYSLGIEQIWMDNTHPVLFATLEKALCDYVTFKKCPNLKDYQESRDFLENDLRIDPSHWSRFDLNKLRALNSVYQNDNIVQLLKVLERDRK